MSNRNDDNSIIQKKKAKKKRFFASTLNQTQWTHGERGWCWWRDVWAHLTGMWCHIRHWKVVKHWSWSNNCVNVQYLLWRGVRGFYFERTTNIVSFYRWHRWYLWLETPVVITRAGLTLQGEKMSYWIISTEILKACNEATLHGRTLNSGRKSGSTKARL